jgi:hypothetical protein
MEKRKNKPGEILLLSRKIGFNPLGVDNLSKEAPHSFLLGFPEPFDGF